MSSADLQKKLDALKQKSQNTIDAIHSEEKRVERGIYIAQHADMYLDKFDAEFEKKTALTKTDIGFLFVAIGLQIARQVLLTKMTTRLSDQEAAKRTPGHLEEHSDRHHRYYNPSLDEIISNPVPFDANIGANGALTGGGALGHRVKTFGHDPVLGLVFGTANIATSTLTTTDFQSYHIYTNEGGRDFFSHPASTAKIFEKMREKLTPGNVEGWTIVGASLVKEIIHLRSDIYTKNSLAMPGLAVVDPQLASTIAGYGMDMANICDIGKQATYAILINSLIAMIHRAFCQDSGFDRKLYEVRTRKILTYSNIASEAANLAYCGITKDWSKLDVGGILVTIWLIITNREYISRVKQEFLFGRFRDLVLEI